MEINTTEALMAWIMNRFSEVFSNKAVLKGGMVLRLLDCPRYTNDLDYVFVPYKSKKDVVKIVQDVLNEIEDAKIEYKIHSTNLQFFVEYNDIKLQVEINVAPECKTQPLSTSVIAKPNSLLPRVISVMSLDWALAHKLAAWNERGLMRDLYDIYFMHHVLGELPNIEILNKRLNKIVYRNAKEKKLPKKMKLKEFLDKLGSSVKKLDSKSLEEELQDYFTQEELIGMDKKIKIGVHSLIENLQNKTE